MGAALANERHACGGKPARRRDSSLALSASRTSMNDGDISPRVREVRRRCRRRRPSPSSASRAPARGACARSRLASAATTSRGGSSARPRLRAFTQHHKSRVPASGSCCGCKPTNPLKFAIFWVRRSRIPHSRTSSSRPARLRGRASARWNIYPPRCRRSRPSSTRRPRATRAASALASARPTCSARGARTSSASRTACAAARCAPRRRLARPDRADARVLSRGPPLRRAKPRLRARGRDALGARRPPRCGRPHAVSAARGQRVGGDAAAEGGARRNRAAVLHRRRRAAPPPRATATRTSPWI